MAGYTKLFNSILHSTIWTEPNEIRILWITMLAMADKEGNVNASIPGLARIAGISIEQTEAGIEKLKSPDAYSRTPAHEGRRIENIDGGWRLLNHGKYRALMSIEERREYNRVKQAERRQKMSMTVNDSGPKSALSAHTEADSEAKADTGKEKKPASTSAASRTVKLSDEEWIAQIKSNPAYSHIIIDTELQKMTAWLSTPRGRGRQRTRQFIVNWLNKIDAPVNSDEPPTKYKIVAPRTPEPV